MKKKLPGHILPCLIALCLCCSNAFSQTDSLQSRRNIPTGNHLRATALTTGVNIFVWSFDKFISDSKFSRINIKTVKSNIETGFVWDSDRIATNHFGHPYNGGLYFSAARANGMNYWQSTAYSAFGSLVWEVFAENEPPGLNDIIATPLAGAAFGEVSHRLSDKILDDSATGWNRFLRELSSTFVNPVRTVDRLFKGDLWRVTSPYAEGCAEELFPLEIGVTLGTRYLTDDKQIKEGKSYPYIGLDLEYGYPFESASNKPFDYFCGHAGIHPGNSGTQPTFGRISITGRLWGREIDTDGTDTEAVWGLFQQYDFYHNRRVGKDSSNDRFNFSETVAAGAGLMLRHSGGGGISFRQNLFADAILLGAVENDNLFIIERHYDMGSGFALKSSSDLSLPFGLRLSLEGKLFYLMVCKDKDYRTLPEDLHPLYYDTPGDKGHSWAFVLNSRIEYRLYKHLWLCLDASRLGIDSVHKRFAPRKARSTEVCFGVKAAF